MRAAHLLLIIMMFLAGCGETADGPDSPAGATPVRQVPTGATVPQTAQEEPFTIVMLGDSLTAGFGLAVDEALPEQMAQILEQNGFDVHVVNAGVSGDTTAGGLARYDWSVASAEPDLLIVALGANDFLNGTSATLARANLSAILERAKADQVDTILAGIATGSVAEEDPRIGEYGAIYPELAAEHQVPLFEDILGGVRDKPSLVQLDGLHPTREGVKIMATRMAKFIGAYLPEE